MDPSGFDGHFPSNNEAFVHTLGPLAGSGSDEIALVYRLLRQDDGEDTRYFDAMRVALLGAGAGQSNLSGPANRELLLSSQTDAKKGLKPTDAEYQLVAEGELAEMWQGRCAAGDPIGCVGFATWGSVNDVQEFFGGGAEADYWVNLGTTVRINARTGLLEGNPFLTSGTGRAYLPWVEKQMGKAIATAHLNATAADLTNRHYFLSAPEITSYHHTVFDKFNVRRKWYGGSYFDGTHSSLLEPFYCRPSCDSY